MHPELDRLIQSVTNITTQAESLIALNAGIAQFMRDHAGDAAAITAAADSLDAESQRILDAVNANATPTA